jgi:hypothetical protein
VPSPLYGRSHAQTTVIVALFLTPRVEPWFHDRRGETQTKPRRRNECEGYSFRSPSVSSMEVPQGSVRTALANPLDDLV